ncbi:BRISC and BRCA1-A complex member 1-like isoform X2 [Ischnura elegans]|uniref:BRISC and BRCA1-A complex member 1-like isoform X2 n=1 Tax=Ischnura elegans TaxID=197161 RepID=UPI001ED8AEBF|nr:BRISC and BRCA1-A complex member 1-like isoform X2 [Ischnura elegans]
MISFIPAFRMESEGENAEGLEGHWVVTGRETGTAIISEPVAMDSMDTVKDHRNSACGSSDDNLISGDVTSVSAKGGSSKESMTPTTNNFENTIETGVAASVETAICPILNADLGDTSRSSPDPVRSKDENNSIDKMERLPSVNVPEKIILCFDLSEDQFYLSTKFNEVNDLSTLNVIKQAIEMFIHSKHMIDKRHEFALVVVHKKAVWLQDFTNKPKDILAVLSELTETPPCDSFCLSSLFDVIKENVTLPCTENPFIVPPPYVIRPIIVYSRCECVPKFTDGQESFHALMSSKYFGFDYIVIHESLSPESDEIANIFSEMCTKPWSLKFIVSRSATKVLDSMAKLLSHPLQRERSSEIKIMEEMYSSIVSNGLR